MWHRCSEVRTDLPAFGVASVSLNLTLADLQSGAACARLVALLQPGQVRLPAATLRPWTSGLGQKTACALGTLLAWPPTKIHCSFQWWPFGLHTTEFTLCLLDVREILRMSLLQILLQRHRSNTEADSSCGALRDTGGAVWPRVTVLVQVSQLWDKNLACHTNASKPRRREEVRRRSPRWPRLLPPKEDGSVIIMIIMGLWGVSFVNEANVMLSELNNAEIAMNNAAQRASCADVSD